MQLDSFFKKKN